MKAFRWRLGGVERVRLCLCQPGAAAASTGRLGKRSGAFFKGRSGCRGLEYDPENPVLWSNLAVVARPKLMRCPNEVWMLAGAFQQAAQGLEKALTIESGA